MSAAGYEPIAHGTVNPYTPYVIPGSHAWPSALPMLEHKRVNYQCERVMVEGNSQDRRLFDVSGPENYVRVVSG